MCKFRRDIMTDTLKAGDTVWTVEGEWIQNFADSYCDIKIPTHVSQQTVTDVVIYGSKDLVKLTNGVIYNIKYGGDIYLTEDEAVKALREERKQFLTVYPNDWQKIVEELKKLLKEQSK